MKSGKRLFDLVPSVALCICLVVLNVLRIIRIPITIDETGYVPTEGYWETMYKSYPSANNHILHSLLRKFFIETFNDSVFFYRVDLLLAQIAFLYFSYKLMQRLYKDGWLVFAGFATLTLVTPWISEFWGLSRGYGLGLMFMVGSIYYMLQYFELRKTLKLTLSISFAALSVYSNFSFLNVFGGVIGGFIIVELIFKSQRKSSLLQKVAAIGLPSTVLALLIVKPLIMVQSGGELNFLGSVGFKNDTVVSLLKCCLLNGNETHLLASVVRITYYGSLIISLFWIFVLARKARFSAFQTEVRTGIFLHLLMVLPFLAQLAQFHLLHINYLIDRAAMFFVLLYILQLVYLFYFLSKVYLPSVKFVVAGIAMLLAGFFFTHINTQRAFLWWYDEDDLVVLKKMDSLLPSKPYQARIWLDWQFVPAFTYDVQHFFPGRFKIIDESRTLPKNDTTFDFLYIRNEDVSNVPPCYTFIGGYCGGASFKLYGKKR